MQSEFSSNKKKCLMLIVKKTKSFDKNFKGDFNLEKNLIKKEKNKNLKYIYTGMQILDPSVFNKINEKVFSMNKIWDKLIEKNQLFGLESNIDFLHVSNIDIYKKLNIK